MYMLSAYIFCYQLQERFALKTGSSCKSFSLIFPNGIRAENLDCLQVDMKEMWPTKVCILTIIRRIHQPLRIQSTKSNLIELAIEQPGEV